MTDVIAAAIVGVLCLIPAAVLAMQAVSSYKQAQCLVGAAVVGRTAMEELRGRKDQRNGAQMQKWNGISYTVLTWTEQTDSTYIKYVVEVKDEAGIIRQYVSLAAAE